VRWTRFFRRDQWDEERARELEAYLEIETDENIARGMPPEEARYAAQRKLGNTALIREEIYRMNSVGPLETLRYDLRFALRMLRRNPGFTAVAVITLALGIGANTALFSFIHAVLLRPLPFPHQDRLMFLSERSAEIPYMYISLADLIDWRARNTVFESLGAVRRATATLTGQGDAQHLSVWQVSADLFPTLGMQAVAGRLFTPEEDQLGAPALVVLGEKFWRDEFDRDLRIIGTPIRLDGELYTLIGVAPSRGDYLLWQQEPDVFVSMGRLVDQPGGVSNRVQHRGVYALARLKPGVSVKAAQAEMTRIAADLTRQYPDTNREVTAVAKPILQFSVEDVRHPLLLLMGAVGLVLLIACANVANLLTALSTARRREIAVRGALGAGAGRLARQFLCESLLLSVIGGAADDGQQQTFA